MVYLPPFALQQDLQTTVAEPAPSFGQLAQPHPQSLVDVYKRQVEVERWLRATGVADGTKAKIKCVMSALFSHAVRWEFCGYNPISSGIPVGSGGKRGPSTGVRIGAKRQRSPLVLSPEQVKLGLAELEFRCV